MKRRTTFEMDEELHSQFKSKCSREHTTMSNVLNNAIKAYLKESDNDVTVTDTMTVNL